MGICRMVKTQQPSLGVILRGAIPSRPGTAIPIELGPVDEVVQLGLGLRIWNVCPDDAMPVHVLAVLQPDEQVEVHTARAMVGLGRTYVALPLPILEFQASEDVHDSRRARNVRRQDVAIPKPSAIASLLIVGPSEEALRYLKEKMRQVESFCCR